MNGAACSTYGQDIESLKLAVSYDTEERIHVQIYDAAEEVYQVPESVFPRPNAEGNISSSAAKIQFSVTNEPFSFAISRSGDNGQTLFNTSGTNLVFQSQYLRLRTQLPEDPHLYGLGEHSDPFMVGQTPFSLS